MTSFVSVIFLGLTSYFSQPIELSYGIGFYCHYQEQIAKAYYSNAKIEEYFSSTRGGGLVFFDSYWFEINLGFSGELGETLNSYKASYESVNYADVNNKTNSNTGFNTLDVRILGKLPFKPIAECTLFPLAGLEYSYTLKASKLDYFSSKTSDWNDFYLDLGAGLDWQLSSFLRIDNDKPYIRTQILYGINLTPHNSNLDVSGVSYADYGWKLGAEILLGTKF